MNKNLLKGKIAEKAMTQSEVAAAVGISRSRFSAKLNEKGGAEFSLGEVRAMKELLCLEGHQVEQIFFS